MIWQENYFDVNPNALLRYLGPNEPLPPLTIEKWRKRKPSYDEWMALIQGIEMWLSDPTGPQNLTEESYDIWCDLMREGFA